MSKSPTKSSTPKLSDLAKHVVAPKGVVSTGWPAVEKKAADLGIRFRPWQPNVGRLILAKRDDGKYAATIGGTGLAIPRQVGKTFLVGAIVFALCLLRPNLTVIWTAHRLRTAEETFGKMQAFAKRKRIAPHIKRVLTGAGDESIEFHNGSRILFGARERGFGRGFDEVDVLIFDEAQILTDNALDDMIPATNQSRQDTGALLLFMGTPPKPKDPGEVFLRMRHDALTGEDPDTGWVEFGADDGYVPPASTAPLTEVDWKQIAKANPSYPQDTPREAILRMRKKLGPDSFLREGLGIFDDTERLGVFTKRGWRHAAIGRPDVAPVALGIAADVDQAWLSLAGVLGGAVSVPPGIPPHLGAVLRSRFDVDRDSFVAEVARISKKYGIPAVVDKRGPAAPLISDLRAAGATVVEAGIDDFVQACADLTTALETETVTHGDYDELNAAVAAATWRMVGDRRVFGRKGGDISMLEAAAWALWAVRQDIASTAAVHNVW